MTSAYVLFQYCMDFAEAAYPNVELQLSQDVSHILLLIKQRCHRVRCLKLLLNFPPVPCQLSAWLLLYNLRKLSAGVSLTVPKKLQYRMCIHHLSLLIIETMPFNHSHGFKRLQETQAQSAETFRVKSKYEVK